MRQLSFLWMRLSADRGQTLAEYGILVVVIAIVVILAAVVLGSSVTNLLSNSSRHI